jgi:hypothetical protein
MRALWHNSGVLDRWQANLLALLATFLLAGYWSGRVVLLVLPIVPALIAFGGFALALFPSKFPGVPWRLITATWVAAIIAGTLLNVLAHVSPCTKNCGEGGDVFWAGIGTVSAALEAFVITLVIGLGTALGRMRRRDRAAR